MKNPRTPEPSRGFKVGDLVHVYNGTSAGTRGYKTIAYMGYVVGFDEHQRKWLVCVVLCLSVSLMIVSALILSDGALLLSPG